MTFKFKRKRLLLSEKNKTSKAIGYARATNNECEYLEDQIKSSYYCIKNNVLYSVLVLVDETKI